MSAQHPSQQRPNVGFQRKPPINATTTGQQAGPEMHIDEKTNKLHVTGYPPVPQYFTYPPPPPIPIEPTPDQDLFAFYSLYPQLILSKIYSENRLDTEHSLSKAFLSDVPGPIIEPELYPDTTNTGVIHDANVRLTQKKGHTDLISTPFDQQGFDSVTHFRPLSTNPEFRAAFQFNHDAPATTQTTTMTTQLQQIKAIKKPYIAPSIVPTQQQQNGIGNNQQQHNQVKRVAR